MNPTQSSSSHNPSFTSAVPTLEDGNIEIWGARVHNLKNIDVTLPRNALTVITG